MSTALVGALDADVSLVHIAPASDDVHMSEAARARWLPLWSETTTVEVANPPTVVSLLHVAPASLEVQTSPPECVPHALVTATRLFPLQSDATDRQPRPDPEVLVVLLVHVAPESVEVQISPLGLAPPMPATATRWVPVESDATSLQSSAPAGVFEVRSIQVLLGGGRPLLVVPAAALLVAPAPPPPDATALPP
jgi:hypothetical protein